MNLYPARDFILLVLGRRDGLQLEIHEAWRIYPAIVRLDKIKTLVDMVERFAQHFSYPVTVGDRTGKFILSAHVPYVPGPPTGIVAVDANSGSHFLVSAMFRVDEAENIIEVAFAMAIDLIKYRRALKSRSIKK